MSDVIYNEWRYMFFFFSFFQMKNSVSRFHLFQQIFRKPSPLDSTALDRAGLQTKKARIAWRYVWQLAEEDAKSWTLSVFFFCNLPVYINVNFFKDLNTALDEALESFDLASTNWLEGKGGRQQQQQPADGVKK